MECFSFRQDVNSIDKINRPYSPYHGRFDYEHDNSNDRWQSVSRSLSPLARDYSPWRRENVDPPGVVQPIESGRYSPFVQRFYQSSSTHQTSDIYGSPMISRKRLRQVLRIYNMDIQTLKIFLQVSIGTSVSRASWFDQPSIIDIAFRSSIETRITTHYPVYSKLC